MSKTIKAENTTVRWLHKAVNADGTVAGGTFRNAEKRRLKELRKSRNAEKRRLKYFRKYYRKAG